MADYYPIFLFLVVVTGFAVSTLVASQFTHLIGLKPFKNTRVKEMPYESGMDPIGDARMQFDVKFYLIAILFLVFDVELLFLYPWAVTAYSDGSSPAWKASVRPDRVLGNRRVHGVTGHRLRLCVAQGRVPVEVSCADKTKLSRKDAKKAKFAKGA